MARWRGLAPARGGGVGVILDAHGLARRAAAGLERARCSRRAGDVATLHAGDFPLALETASSATAAPAGCRPAARSSP